MLRSNDCVILPGFGGFIAHDVPAYYVSEEGLYFPPSRSISFNAAITMNDGVLAQSYMRSYQVDYARATYMIDMAVEELLDTLYEEGSVTLPRIGTIRQDIHQTIQFAPEFTSITSTTHFGLSSFAIKELSQLNKKKEEAQSKGAEAIITHSEKTINLHINKGTLRRVLSTAAVLLMLLMVSLPIGEHPSTDVASLHLMDMIAMPEKQAAATEENAEMTAMEAPAEVTEAAIPTEAVAETDNTVAAAEETIPAPTTETAVEAIAETVVAEPVAEQELTQAPAPAPAPVVAATTTDKVYHIIVASLPNHRGANETLRQYINKGYPNASLVERDDRIRISLMQFTDKDEANNYLKILREESAFQNAWLLAVRN